MSDHESARRIILARRLRFLSAALAMLSPEALADTSAASTSSTPEVSLRSTEDLHDPNKLRRCLEWNSYAATWPQDRADKDSPEAEEARAAHAAMRDDNSDIELLERLVRLDPTPKAVLQLIQRLTAENRTTDALALSLRFEPLLVPEFEEELLGLRRSGIAQVALLEVRFDDMSQPGNRPLEVRITKRTNSGMPIRLVLTGSDLPRQICLDAGPVEVEEWPSGTEHVQLTLFAGQFRSLRLDHLVADAYPVPCLQPLRPPQLELPRERPAGLQVGVRLGAIAPVVGTAGGSLDALARLDLNKSPQTRVSLDALAGASATTETVLIPVTAGFTLRKLLDTGWGMGLSACGGYVAVVNEERDQLRSSLSIEPKIILWFMPGGENKQTELLLDVGARLSEFDQNGDTRFGLTQIVLGLTWSTLVLSYPDQVERTYDAAARRLQD